MSTNEATTQQAVIGIYVKEFAKVVDQALKLYADGLVVDQLPALLASWDTLTHRDVDFNQGLEDALMEIRATVDAILADEGTLEIKEK